MDSKYVKAWAKKGDIEFFMKEYHKALDSYKMVRFVLQSDRSRNIEIWMPYLDFFLTHGSVVLVIVSRLTDLW